MDIPTKWMIRMRNNSIEACALTYVNHQRIACLEQKISARATVSQGWGYYHIRSYPLCWSHQATIKYLVWIWDSRQWSQSGWFRNSCDKSESVRKMVMPQPTVWNPKYPHLVEEPNARSKSLGFHQEKSDHQFMDSLQNRHNNRKSPSDSWDRHIFQTW